MSSITFCLPLSSVLVSVICGTKKVSSMWSHTRSISLSCSIIARAQDAFIPVNAECLFISAQRAAPTGTLLNT